VYILWRERVTEEKQRAAFSCFLNCRAQLACYIAVHQASKNLDTMVEESMRDIPSDEEASGDENDPELLVSKLLLIFQYLRRFQVSFMV